MKKICRSLLLSIPIWALAGFLTSCDQGFDELNINKTAATAVNPIFTLNNALINASITNGTIQYEMSIVQQMITPNSGVLAGANFNQDNRDNTQQIWQRFYRNVVRNTYDVITTA
jgi:hypothetical protein